MQLSLKFRESTKNALFCPKIPLNDVIFEQTKLQKLDWDIMNTFQSQSVNIYGKRANARGGALCAPPHQPSMKKSPSGLGLTSSGRGPGAELWVLGVFEEVLEDNFSEF